MAGFGGKNAAKSAPEELNVITSQIDALIEKITLKVTAALTTKHVPVRKKSLILTIPEKMNLEMKSEIIILQ